MPYEINELTLTSTQKRRMNLVGKEWYSYLVGEFSAPYFESLNNKLGAEYIKKVIYPEHQDVFKAFKMTPLNKVKVVILGQDPYYNGRANGLAFGYKDGLLGRYKKGSLEVIWEELESDIEFGQYLNFDGTLNYWAEQGVLLLNKYLTVRYNEPLSHSLLGWDLFTGRVIETLFKQKNIVFMLWGKEALEFARSWGQFYDPKNHLILKARHPAADIYNADSFGDVISDYPNTFKGCKHFSKANNWLKSKGIEEIKW